MRKKLYCRNRANRKTPALSSYSLQSCRVGVGKIVLLNKLFGVFIVLVKRFPHISSAHNDGDVDRS